MKYERFITGLRRTAFMLFIFSCAVATAASGPDLRITQDDVYIEERLDGGFHLFVRKKPGIGSVLLADTTADPAKKIPSYTLRAGEYNPTNGDEKRVLNGKIINRSSGLNSIVDSTPEPNKRFGDAFHLFVPYVVVYGYSWGTRTGTIQISDGTFINIMSFEKPYADYTGKVADNPFLVTVVQKPRSDPEKTEFMPKAVEEFEEIAEKSRGKVVRNGGKDELVEEIGRIIAEQKGKTLDLVLALDTTKSMEDDVPFLKRELVPLLERVTVRFESFRIGIVLYRDYLDDYLTRTYPFETDLGRVRTLIQGITVDGGRDMPEAVYEALDEAERKFDWQAESRLIILIGDAPPHPKPKGKITRDTVYDRAEKLDITIDTIILPQ